MSRTLIAAVCALLLAGTVNAVTISVEDLACLPVKQNAVVHARLAPEISSGQLRLYFRRLNPQGAFYYSRMWPGDAGAYWGVLPRPEDRTQIQLTDAWWEILRTRDWMQIGDRDRRWLEEWLAERKQEAAEIYAAVYDAAGALVERSDTRLVELRAGDECAGELTVRERGWADNLTVGETTELQSGRELFHWLCDGLAARISADGILRGDDVCRACVISELPAGAGDPVGQAGPQTVGAERQGDLIGRLR